MSALPTSLASSTSGAGAVIEVRECDRDDPGWNAYVEAHPRATFFHQSGWLEALRTLSHRPLRLTAVRRGELRGVLPLCVARDHRRHSVVLSLPHTVYGGVLADDEASERALWEAALRIAAACGARRIELRNRHATTLDLPNDPGFATFERALPDSARALLAGYRKGARTAIAQAERFGLEASPTQDLDVFYSLMQATYRRLGTPVYPRSFLAAIRERFPESVSMLIVRHESRPVAGVYALRFRTSLMALFSGALPEARPLRADNLKYHRLMERAIVEGVKTFDLGRSRSSNPGVMAFKRHLGATAIPLHYQVWPGATATGADPNSGSWLALRRLWSALPAAVSNRLGPPLVRRFP